MAIDVKTVLTGLLLILTLQEEKIVDWIGRMGSWRYDLTRNFGLVRICGTSIKSSIEDYRKNIQRKSCLTGQLLKFFTWVIKRKTKWSIGLDLRVASQIQENIGCFNGYCAGFPPRRFATRVLVRGIGSGLSGIRYRDTLIGLFNEYTKKPEFQEIVGYFR